MPSSTSSCRTSPGQVHGHEDAATTMICQGRPGAGDATIPACEREHVAMKTGRIILVNGTSSAGKSTLCRALQETLALPVLTLFVGSSRRCRDTAAGGGSHRSGESSRGATCAPASSTDFIAPFRHSPLPATTCSSSTSSRNRSGPRGYAIFSAASTSTSSRSDTRRTRSSDARVERERRRGDRTVGEALYHEKTYGYLDHDLEVGSTRPAPENARLVMRGWQERSVRSGLP